jgi:hypothetical protein
MIPNRLQPLYQKYERWVPIIFFILGFVFDTLMLKRVDELKVILQQALYIVVAGFLIGVEILELTREIHPPAVLKKVWRYREALLHFLLGTLLNSYTIFYFKSTSSITSFFFIAVLVGLLITNEFKHFGKSQTKVHVAFLSLCVISYLVSLLPIILGFIGVIPFLSAVVASAAAFGVMGWFLKKPLSEHPLIARNDLFLPYAGIQLLFVVLYFARAIPPVPLSATYMGIFHDVEKKDGGYELTYTRSKWKFWQHGDQTFSARPGDTIYFFTQVFSPARFKDKLLVRWFYHDARRGWVPSDSIPLDVSGGREEGYRGVMRKKNFQPGDWRVQIETDDEREVGRLGFTVETDADSGDRELKTEMR